MEKILFTVDEIDTKGFEAFLFYRTDPFKADQIARVILTYSKNEEVKEKV